MPDALTWLWNRLRYRRCTECGLPRGYHSPAILRPPLSIEYHRFVQAAPIDGGERG